MAKRLACLTLAFLGFLAGGIVGSMIGTDIWWRLTAYNGDMPYGIIVFLQIPKTVILGGGPFLIFLATLPRWWRRSFSVVPKLAVLSGILWPITALSVSIVIKGIPLLLVSFLVSLILVLVYRFLTKPECGLQSEGASGDWGNGERGNGGRREHPVNKE